MADNLLATENNSNYQQQNIMGDQIWSNLYAVFKNSNRQVPINLSSISFLASDQFLQAVYEPLVDALDHLITYESNKERNYLKQLYEKIRPFVPSDSKALIEKNFEPGSENLSMLFNILKELEEDTSKNFSNFQQFYELKQKQMKLYGAGEWKKILEQAIDKSFDEDLTLDEFADKVEEVMEGYFPENTRSASKQFYNAFKKYKEKLNPMFLKFLGFTEEQSQLKFSNITEDHPYIIKKRKSDKKYQSKTLKEILHNFAVGSVYGLFSEFRGIGDGKLVLNTGSIKNDFGKNIESDKMEFVPFEFTLDQSTIEELQNLPTITDLNTKISELYNTDHYFRIEYSVKSSTKNAPKIKDASSFSARFEQLREMGSVLGQSKAVEDLIFTIINSVPGFIADDFNPSILAKAIATLGFAFMFDLEKEPILNSAQQLADEGIQEERLHIYEVNTIFYTVSDVLKAIRQSLDIGKGKYFIVTSSTIQYNGLSADLIRAELDNQELQSDEEYWILTRNTILNIAPRLNLQYPTFGKWNFSKGESSTGLRMNFNDLLKKMRSL